MMLKSCVQKLKVGCALCNFRDDVAYFFMKRYPLLDCRLQQVAVEEVQRASATTWNQQELPPAMSSFCRSVVQNTLMHSPKTSSDIPHDTNTLSSSHREDQQEHVVAFDSSSSNQESILDTLYRSRDLSPCLDTSPVHTGYTTTMFEPDMVLRVDDEDEAANVTFMLGKKNEGSCRDEAAAAGVASWSGTQGIGAAAWAAHMSDFNANETSSIGASVMSQAACLPSVSPTNLNSIPIVAVHLSSTIAEDPSLPSRSSPNVFDVVPSAAAGVSLELQRVHENATRVGDLDEDAPVHNGTLPLAIKKLQLDKVRQESQVNSQRV